MRKIFIGSVLFTILILGGLLYFQPYENYLIINGNKIYVELAADQFARKKGLSGRERLESNQGLLFMFPHDDNRFFWMKGMKFPIDIIWIKNNVIVGIEHNVPLSEGPDYPHYISPEPLSRVLEINANLAKKLGLATGQEVKFHLLGE